MENIRIYFYDFQDREIKSLKNQILPETIKERINIFSNEIINEYTTKQIGIKGVKSLGNEIRYNDTINNQVFISRDKISLVKITGNRKDFLKDFLNALHYNHTVFYLLFESSFVRLSSIVDRTSTSIENIEDDLKLLFSHVSLNKSIKFYFLEFCYLKNFTFSSDGEGFKKIKKLNNGI